MEAGVSKGPTLSTSLRKQKQFHDQAYQYISEAIDCEEESPGDALALYQRGLDDLNKALSIIFSDSDWFAFIRTFYFHFTN